jgi:HD-like signal output (HDOD) protein
MVEDPDCPLGDVGKAVAADPAIALKALRLVNSAYYGLGQRVTSVEHAVNLLGIKVVKNLVYTATVFDTFKDGADYVFRHSIACGVAMRALVESGPQAYDIGHEEAFVYGIVHDSGKLVLQEHLPEEFEKANQLCLTEGIPIFEAEQRTIGVDHAVLGAALAQNWKLPDELVQAIGAHHDLSRCSETGTRLLAASVAVADYMAGSCGMMSTPGAPVVATPGAWTEAGLTSQGMADVMAQFFTLLPGVEELVQIASSAAG